MLKIVKDSNKSLREKCVPVEMPLSKKDEKLLLEMLDYLKKSQDDEYAEKNHIRSGVGMAAPQVGVNKRMFVIYYQLGDKLVQYALVNPKIVATSIKLCYLSGGEGCLSVDKDHEGYVYRPNKVTIKAYNLLEHKDVEIVARGYDAIVLQHEFDHLNGILYYDHIDKNNPFRHIDNTIEI